MSVFVGDFFMDSTMLNHHLGGISLERVPSTEQAKLTANTYSASGHGVLVAQKTGSDSTLGYD